MNKITELKDRLRDVIEGGDETLDLILVAPSANGHVLIKDVPGVGKPTLAKDLFVPILAHRVALDTKARYSGVIAGEVVASVLGQVPVPV